MPKPFPRTKSALDESKEKYARKLSAETLIDVRTVRRWLRGERVMRGNRETLERAAEAGRAAAETGRVTA